jgi:hypothetical protein
MRLRAWLWRRGLWRLGPITRADAGFWAWWLRGEEPGEYHELAYRALTEREREILDFLLTTDLPGIGELREQAETAVAVRYSSRDPSFGLWLDREGPQPSSARTRPLIQTYTKWQGAKDLYSLILWVGDDGSLGAVELTPLHADWPAVLPPPSDFGPPGPYDPAA